MADLMTKFGGAPKAKAAPAASSKDDAASDVLAAVKAGDAKALSLALERHYEACEGGDDEAEETEPVDAEA